MMNIRHGIVVNDNLLPTTPLIAKIIDPFSLTDLSGADIEVDVLDFSTAAYSMAWLIGARGIAPVTGPPGHCNWCVYHARDIPLLNEIKDMVNKARDLRSARAFMRDTFVFVRVRGKTLLVANKRRNVALALPNHPRIHAGSFEDKAAVLSWFLAELRTEIETLTRRAPPEEDEVAKAIKAGLVVLRASSEVCRATWRPPQNAFRVTKKNQKNVKTFKVPAPKTGKTQKAAIDKVVADALRWAERFTVRRAERGD